MVYHLFFTEINISQHLRLEWLALLLQLAFQIFQHLLQRQLLILQPDHFQILGQVTVLKNLLLTYLAIVRLNWSIFSMMLWQLRKAKQCSHIQRKYLQKWESHPKSRKIISIFLGRKNLHLGSDAGVLAPLPAQLLLQLLHLLIIFCQFICPREFSLLVV